MNLTSYYDKSGPHGINVKRLSTTRAWIEMSTWLVVVVPHAADDPKGEALDPVGAAREKAFRLYTETSPVAHAQLTLGELTAWALRRASTLSEPCEECTSTGRMPDRQRILGTIYDRNWVRDGLQWLYQQRVSFDAIVSIELVQSPSPSHGPGDNVLLMRHGEWIAVGMCCRQDAGAGDDPLETRARP